MNDQGKLIGGFSSAGAPMPNDLSIYFGLLSLAQSESWWMFDWRVGVVILQVAFFG